MSEQGKALLIFNGVKHHLHLVQKLGATGPMVGIATEDINIKGRAAFEGCDLPVLDDAPVLFYKWEGKYIVFLGHSRVEKALIDKQTVVKGRLISSPALKKTRVVIEPAVTTTVIPSIVPALPTRYRDERPSRYAQNGPARYPGAYQK